MLKILWSLSRTELEEKSKEGVASGEEEALLAALHMYFIHGARDSSQVLRSLERGVEQKSALACVLRAENHFFGENGYPQSKEATLVDASEALRLSEAQGAPSVEWMACSILGWVAEDAAAAEALFVRSLPLLRADAEAQQCPIAEDWLAWRYCNGQGVAKDVAEGMRWFRISAEHGLPWAKYWLALRYFQGDGVEKDLEQSRSWCEAAAAHGVPDAIALLESSFTNVVPSSSSSN